MRRQSMPLGLEAPDGLVRVLRFAFHLLISLILPGEWLGMFRFCAALCRDLPILDSHWLGLFLFKAALCSGAYSRPASRSA